MNELVTEVGVNRSSLYATYGQKEDLFLRALTHYDQVHRQDWLADLCERFGPSESIRQAFAEVAAAPETSRRLGCLLVNTSTELASGYPTVSTLVWAERQVDALEPILRWVDTMLHAQVQE